MVQKGHAQNQTRTNAFICLKKNLPIQLFSSINCLIFEALETIIENLKTYDLVLNIFCFSNFLKKVIAEYQYTFQQKTKLNLNQGILER